MVLEATFQANNRQKRRMVAKIEDGLGGVAGQTIALLGLAFKPNTDDLREAPAITIINGLLQKGAKVKAYDPEARDGARKIFGSKIEITEGPYQAVQGADALVLVTEWGEFRHPNFERIRESLKSPVIFDGRNIYDAKILRDLGFAYYGMGRS